MTRLIDDLLDVARNCKDEIALKTESHDLVTIVRQTAQDYQPSLLTAGIDLKLDLAEEPLYLME